MHSHEVPTDAGVVRRLVAEQFPAWAHLPVEPVRSDGTDNAMYRLGAELVVRLPRTEETVAALAREQRYLTYLAPQLPLSIPHPVGAGRPASDFPLPWSVYRWLPGQDAARSLIADVERFAHDLAGFVRALHAVDAVAAPPAYRSDTLTARDQLVRAAVVELGDRVNAEAVLRVWDVVLDAPARTHPPVWIHGDLTPGNLLITEGRLGAVIDFGGTDLGDPAVDLLPAWNLFTGAARETYRAALGVDDATWTRGRGWALSVALIAMPYYWQTNPAVAATSRDVVAELLSTQQ